MPDPSVEQWRQRGNVAMWRNRDGSDTRWNISCDQLACESLGQLLELMRNAKWPNKIAVDLTQPNTVANGSNADLQFARTATISFPTSQVPDDHWLITGGDQPAICLGYQRLAEFKSALVDICSGNGDYTIGNDANGLWVWWWVTNNQ